MFTNTYFIITLKLETTQVSNEGRMDKQLVAYYSVKYFSAILMPAVTLVELQKC